MKLAVAIAFVAIAAGSAVADNKVNPFVGASAGAGYSTSDHRIAIVSVRGGAVMRPDLVLFAEGSAQVCVDDRALGAGARYWPWRRVWVAGTIGVARRSVAPAGSGCFPDAFKRSTGFSASSQLGFDLMRRKYFRLEIAARARYEFYGKAFDEFEDEEKTRGLQTQSLALELGVSFF